MELLGKADVDRKLESKIRELAVGHHRAVRWSSLYDCGYAAAVGDEGYLDGRLGELAADRYFAMWAMDLVLVAPPTDNRSEFVVELFEGGLVPPDQVGRIQFTGLTSSLSVGQLERLVSATDSSPRGRLSLVSLLSYFHDQNPAMVHELQGVSLSLLEATLSDDMQGLLDYEWSEIAKRYVEVESIRVAQMTLRWIEAQESAHLYGCNELLSRARDATASDTFFMDVVSPWLDHDDLTGWWVINSLPSSVISELQPERLIEWVEQRPGVRARRVAEVLGAPSGQRVSDIHGELLARYDEEHGVGNIFFGDLVSGVWWGSAAAQTRGLVDTVTAWGADERPTVQEWSRKAKQALVGQLESEEIKEEEEEFRF